MKKLLLMSAMLSASAVADYQVELEAGLGHTESYESYGYGSRPYLDGYRSWGVAGTYYLAPVATQAVPLSDAGFLSKSSSVAVALMRQDPEDIETTTVDLEAIWVSPQGFFAGISYYDYEDDYGESSTFTDAGPGILLGTYLGDTSAVRLHYEKTEFDSKAPGYRRSEPDREKYTLAYKNVVMVDGRAHSSIEVELAKSNYAVELDTSLGWYLGNNFKYGVAVGLSDYDASVDHRSYGAWLEYFIVENLAIAADFTVAKYFVSDVDGIFRLDEKSFFLSGKYRF